ncbi:hypothetical protein [Variovorax ginsengisoli]|uniref:HipA-like C-terminal domain-containing protein n=1 Tax=Variovorax ginsengisoli TaxID=363844 RepID=A0ABT8SB44_9BURK|nr:hypothetical protein [Variovorax ginsengisoli]MDN8615496.1 hypothetical protein [Variovorax ginsengisoli]MDO1534666.1 hypothetical protein [Variovorax ginsengisoli]
MKFQPAHMLIQLLGPEDFVTPYGWTNDQQGNACPVLHGRFDIPSRGIVDCYAKAFDPDEMASSVMCLNEITGWLLGQAYGLPVAECAFVARISASELPPYAGSSPLPTPCADGTIFFFCTQEITRSQVRAILPTLELVAEQARWSHSHATIALDECIANADRHLNNLIRRSVEDFALIDHGRLLFRGSEPCWVPDQLESLSGVEVANILHYNTYKARGVFGPAETSNGYRLARDSADRHGQNINKAFYEISLWCAQLIPGVSAHWLRFLHRRQQAADDLLSRRFAVLRLVQNNASPTSTP